MLFDSQKKPLDFVAVFVEIFVQLPRGYAVGFGGNNHRGGARFERLYDGIRVVRFVGDDGFRVGRQRSQNGVKFFAISRLTRRYVQVHRIAQRVHCGVQFGV